VPRRTAPPLETVVRAAFAQVQGPLSDLEDPAARVRAVNNVLAAVEEELAALAVIRIEAVLDLRRQGWSLDRIARETGLSKARVAQIARDPRR